MSTISFARNAFAKNGSALESKSIDWLLSYSQNLNPQTPKGKDGAIFAYDADVTGIKDDSKSGGLLFIDVDNLSKTQAEEIFNGFQIIADYLPPLYAVQYSSSHFLSEAKSGLHFFVTTRPGLDRGEYAYLANLAYAFILALINREFDIDLRLVDKAIDNHNSAMYQKFFVHYSPYQKGLYWNEERPFDGNFLSEGNIKYLKQEYGEFLRLNPQTSQQSPANLNNIYKAPSQLGQYGTPMRHSGTRLCSIRHKDKLLIDRDFYIGEYSGNGVRWRISNIALQVFGSKDKAKEWCDEYFYKIEKGRHQSIYSINRPTAISPVVLNWLVSNGYLVIDDPDPLCGTQARSNVLYDGLHLGEGEWLSSKKNDILDFISTHDRSEIVAPTGTGKTTLINEIARDLNAVVIVPFNVTNRLYNMACVSSETDTPVPDDMPCTMVWDQAIKHWSEIKDRVLIVDEAHCLFLDRNYRDAAVKLMLRIKDRGGKLVLFTATPSGETDELGCEVLNVKSQHRMVPVNFIKVNHVDYAQYNYILRALKEGWCDRVVMFDDRNARKIYEKLVIEGELIGEIAYIRADTKKTDDFISLRNTEMLSKKLTICTCVAFNGLNFRNKDERVMVITSWMPGVNTANELIQEVGRIRNSEVQMVVFWDGKVAEDTLDERIETAEALSEAEVEMNIAGGLLEYDSKLLDTGYRQAMTNIQDYINEHSMKAPEELSATGYMVVSQIDKQTENKGGGMQLELKRKANREFVSDVFEMEDIQDYVPETTDDITGYKMGWTRRLRRLVLDRNYKGVDMGLIKEILQNKKSDVMIETVFDDIERIIMVSLLSEAQWESYESQLEDVKKVLKKSPLKQKRLMSRFKKDKQFRLKYKDVVKSNSFDNIDLSELFDSYLGDVKEEYEAFKASSGNGGKTCKKAVIAATMPESKRTKYGLHVGDEFDSCGSLAVQCGVKRGTISEWMSRKWIL